MTVRSFEIRDRVLVIACILVMAAGITLGHMIEAWGQAPQRWETSATERPRVDLPAEAPE